jgi:hypothetical protein
VAIILDIKAKSQRQEKSLSKKLNGRLTVNSGATSVFDKADVATEDFLIECKTTDKKSFSLKKEILKKVEKEANFKNKIPLLEVEIGHDKYIVCKERDFFAIIKDEFIGG